MAKKMEFKFDTGDEVEDKVTGYKGMIIGRTQWHSNCNTYGVKSHDLKDGTPIGSVWFDEPNLKLVKLSASKPKRKTGGPTEAVSRTNRQ